MPKLKVLIRPYPGDYTIIDGKLYLNGHAFTFDTILNNVGTECVYSSIKEFTRHFIRGKNATIFAYGQTGSGKSYTMGLNGEEGVIHFTLKDVFIEAQNLDENIENNTNSIKSNNICFKIAMVEIYNEEIFDLLNKKKNLNLRFNKDLIISGLTEHKVTNYEDCISWINLGLTNRLTKKTAVNDTSSRSHGIIILSFYKDDLLVSKFSFVDLAGSERIKKSKVSGLERREAICINSSLLSLCNCIHLLSKKNTYKNIHIPYRQSKLTRILQYALEGDCFTAMIVCINGNNFESYDALNYATRAMNIQLENVKQENSKIDLNTIIKENKELKNIIEQLKIENTQFKEENNILKKKLTDYFEIKKENKLNISEKIEKAQNKNISSTEMNKKKVNKFNQLKNTSIDEKINKLTVNDLLNTPTKINNLTNKNLFMFPIDKSTNEDLKRLKNVNLKKVTFSENNEYKFITPIRNRVSLLGKISDLMKKNEEGNSKKND